MERLTIMSAILLDVTARPYQFEHDFWGVRDLLLRTYATTPTGLNWELRRWDGWHFHRMEPLASSALAQCIRVWEGADGEIVAAAHPEGEGDLFLEVDPDHRDLEDEMLAWGEEKLGVVRDGHRQVDVFVFDYDIYRQRLLEKRGYAQMRYGGVTRRLRFGRREIPLPELPPDYILRATRADDRSECARMAALLNAAFRRTIHSETEYWNFATKSPSFRHDLNLIAEAPGGMFAAHVGVTYDDANCRAIFEPVCTHPDHQRKGLARALMLEGLHRARALGAVDAFVDTGDGMAANYLYEAVGFTEVYHGYVWRKVW